MMLELWQNFVDRHNIACEIIVSILFDQLKNEFFKVDLNRWSNFAKYYGIEIQLSSGMPRTSLLDFSRVSANVASGRPDQCA
ncbi:hypothetical protein T03_5217 [Trichinella britovi]|uniref:Uncharacterized protein n=2 Tax=Trichinella TaxID=6333 RepID=A0A0V1CMZ4_TRIBR|nr:hypothetical protein T05_7589 [Trichinella murrelli]KRY50650.1 hypothetical protein T03_5217 [Trichinella britovi]